MNYNFSAFVGNQTVEREMVFGTADFFSWEIQGNECENGGKVWHFPVKDWGINERFCIRLPSHSSRSIDAVR